jgi:outer membrane protein OmpA-like peptidoglycan-associated protein
LSTSTDPLSWLLLPASANSGIDRRALAGLLLDVARNVKPDLDVRPPGVDLIDLRLEQLRELVLGREIEVLSRLRAVVEDPEQLALAVSRILPTAFAQASSDARLGQVLAPTLEQAAQSSIRSDPRTLVNILYPLIVPAIRKSIGETIDQIFQSLNESLKYSLTWRGLRWRWEAWRTGTSFAEVVLKHTLIYQVEHAFLIHGHTGLLIAHAAAENATSQDPQLVSSMLTAIQDFVRDSFGGAEQQGLDTLQLGELRLWSEPGPFATLVAVIRGNPPEALHETLVNVVSRIHVERHHALEAFDGDSSGLADVEAELSEVVALRQQAPARRRTVIRWLVAPIALALLLAGGIWHFRSQDARRWDDYVARLRGQPGIVITEAGRQDGKFMIAGLRDPLAVDPRQLLSEAEIDPARVIARWAPYEAFDPLIVLKRLTASLSPPPGVSLTVKDGRIVAQGSAPSPWLERARVAGRLVPTGSPALDLSAVEDVDGADKKRWDDYVARLRTEPGIMVVEAGVRDGKFSVAGLRDPLAVDPAKLLNEAGIDPTQVVARWAPYGALDPPIVLKRLQEVLDPPPTVSLSVEGGTIVANGSATSIWLQRARIAGRTLPRGAPSLDLSRVEDAGDGALGKLRDAIQSRTILFNNNEPLPAPGQDAGLDQLAGDLRGFAALAAALRVTARVTLTGHADSLGKGTANLSLSLARAEAVRALLGKRGVDPDFLAVRGAGALESLAPDASEAGRSGDRRVSFTVVIDDHP